jgi:7,8-dihydropterin-6-yl-methyl-4-(beta-D-ribofuranosyl)aminobenzene 5'-phosphate synthase
MKTLNRRDFIRLSVFSAGMMCIGGHIMPKPVKAGPGGAFDIGECKSVKVKCISELGWLDNKKLLEQITAAGGPGANQWTIPWDPQNAAGSCSLVDLESLDGTHHKFLIDAGWGHPYMEECFKREGIDRMLKNGEIEFLFITHEHMDHFWGIETVLQHNPEIPIFLPNTFYREGMHFIKGAEFISAGARNRVPHTGKLVMTEPGQISQLYDGCASVTFDLPILIRVRGEQSLYFNIKNKGIVCLAGCCHHNVLTTAKFGRDKIKGGENMYGIYGGLHISPFGPLNAESEKVVAEMAEFNFKKVACNHCTGIAAVQKMHELGYPVVKGNKQFGSLSDLYIGNGDEVEFS